MNIASSSETRIRAISWLLAGSAMIVVLQVHLLPALLAGLLIFELVHLLAPLLQRRFASARARLAAAILLAIVIVGAIAAAVLGLTAFFKSEAGSMSALFGKMAQIIEDARSTLPSWLIDRLPLNAEALQKAVVHSLREHAAELRTVGKETAMTLAHILIGLVIGAMVAAQESLGATPLGPLGRCLLERARRLADAFRRIVFAQVRISALNSGFTALYLLVVLPLCGIDLPLTKTLVIVTFIAGLLPVVGNLISNGAIVVVSLAHSPQVALASLAFLVVIHKLEYFLNARIVGGQINARAWELLTAMLLMEALFGISGVVAAPIFYAWIKDELVDTGML
ncbi:MAG TPA: AI-2E family transporter [Rhodocyclaceae bacterium]|nr:AI-2E family transporter [Rhodocyclaceae bacterium]